MKRTINAALVAFSLGMAACGPMPSDPAGETDIKPSLAMGENSREEISAIAHGCPGGEDVQISGILHKVLAVTGDASGGLHINGHFDWTFKGIGVVTGARYVGFQQDKLTRTAAPGVRSATEVFHGRLVGLGGAPDAGFRVLWHITVTPDGKVASFFDTFALDC